MDLTICSHMNTILLYQFCTLANHRSRSNLPSQLSKFLHILKQWHIDIPLIETLEHIPKYAKFLKDILSKKMKLEERETIMLTE